MYYLQHELISRNGSFVEQGGCPRDEESRNGIFRFVTWASAAVKKIGEYTEKLKFEVVGNPVEMKQSMKEDTCRQVRNWQKLWQTV
mgnify:FL=1